MKAKIFGVIAASAVSAVVSPAYSGDLNYVYSNGSLTMMAPPGVGTPIPTRGINDTGKIVGAYSTNSPCCSSTGFIYSNRSYATINAPYGNVPGAYSETSSTSTNVWGQIVGSYLPSNNIPPGQYSGFLYSNGAYTTITPPGSTYSGDIGNNNSIQINGNSYIGSFDSFTTIAFPGSTSTGIVAINASGQVVGSYKDSSNTSVGLHYSNSIYTTIAVPGATSTYATSINDLATIAGYFSGSSSINEGFLYSNSILTLFALLGDPSAFTTGINNSDQVLVPDRFGRPSAK
jgi:hypothetical protein